MRLILLFLTFGIFGSAEQGIVLGSLSPKLCLSGSAKQSPDPSLRRGTPSSDPRTIPDSPFKKEKKSPATSSDDEEVEKKIEEIREDNRVFFEDWEI